MSAIVLDMGTIKDLGQNEYEQKMIVGRIK